MFKNAMSFLLAGLLVGAIGGWIGRGLIAQPANAPTITVFKNWQLTCPAPAAEKDSCALSQNVVDPKSGGVVIRFILSADNNGRKLVIGAPFNVLLQPGLGLKLDGGDMQTFAYKTCNESGCLARISADEKLYNGVLNAKKIEVFYESLDTKTSGWALSMDGFSDAISAMDAAEASRHSWFGRVML